MIGVVGKISQVHNRLHNIAGVALKASGQIFVTQRKLKKREERILCKSRRRAIMRKDHHDDLAYPTIMHWNAQYTNEA